MTVCRWLLTLAIVAQASAAAAHKPKPQRELILQVDAEGVVAFWRMVVRGPQADLLRGVHDRDANGRLNGAEVLVAATAVLAKASGGVRIGWDDATLQPAKLDPRLEASEHGQPLTAVGLTPLRGAEVTAAQGRHQLTVEVGPKQGPLSVVVQALGPWLLEASGLPMARDARGLREPVVLDAKQRLEVWVRRVPGEDGSGDGEEGIR